MMPFLRFDCGPLQHHAVTTTTRAASLMMICFLLHSSTTAPSVVDASTPSSSSVAAAAFIPNHHHAAGGGLSSCSYSGSPCQHHHRDRQQQQQQHPNRVPTFVGKTRQRCSCGSRRRQQSRPPSSSLAATAGENDKQIPTEWQGEVLAQLSNVIDPDLNRDIVTLGFVQNLRLVDDDTTTTRVAFDVELTTPACPVKEQFAADCQRYVEELDWVDHAVVTMTAQEQPASNVDVSGMSQIRSIIAVSSCKGGVGKSTTAVNLAYALQKLGGARVGILDADVYGPSLPTMIQPDDDIVRFVGRQIAPLTRNGVKLMSFGYINEDESAAIMRGPMITQLLDQFLSVIEWGQLDYLILDLPPGTGDIQLTLTQRLNITAAVIVTTPQELSYVDVVRGIQMFDSVNVPCVAVVENMAYYELPQDHQQQQQSSLHDEQHRIVLIKAFIDKLSSSEQGAAIAMNGAIDQLAEELVDVVMEQQRALGAKTSTTQPTTTDEDNKNRIPIFGQGHKHRISEQWGIEHTFSVPLASQIASTGDAGTPFVLEYPGSTQARIYDDLAETVVREVAKVQYAALQNQTRLRYDPEEHLIQVSVGGDSSTSQEEEGDEQQLSPAELRRACRCAACVEELTGRQILMKTDVAESIQPRSIAPTGNYAVSVDWSDGHRSLYPYRRIRSLLEEKRRSRQDDGREGQPRHQEMTERATMAKNLR